MLKSEFAKKKSLRLKLIKVGIGHPPAQTPMSDYGRTITRMVTIQLKRIKNDDLKIEMNPLFAHTLLHI